MKKGILIAAFLAVICTSFFAGKYYSEQNHLQDRAQRCSTMLVFAVDKLEDLQLQYDADSMEALISNIYAAYEFCDSGELSVALHDLWNALIIDGENLVGMENDLITALKEADPQSIEAVAARMRGHAETA